MELETYFIRYKFTCGPGREIRRGAVLEINCQAWAHKILRDRFGIMLPETLLSKELFEDTIYTRSLGENEPVRAGDIFLFGQAHATDMRTLHWAIATGAHVSGEPILEHVNIKDGTVGFWPKNAFAREARYEKLFAVKRPCHL